MAIGGPAGFAAGFLQGIARHRQTANTRVREQLNEALRLQKEAREAQDAIAKEGLAGEKAKAEAALAQNELDLIEQRRAEIMASSGKPFRDSAMEGRLAAAKQRLADAEADTTQSRNRLQDLIEARDERISRGVPATKAGGFLGFGQKEVPPEQRTPEQREAYKAARRKAEQADTPENRDFNREFREDYRDIGRDKRQESKESASISGEERAIEVGKGEQGTVNEEERKKELYPLDKQASEYREKQVAANAAMSAAAQEIQNRQQQQTQLQATPGYGRAMQGGAAMGKGGGGGGGLLGAIAGKGGGTAQPATSMGAPAQQGQPAASPGPGGVPSVGQAAMPILGKIAQMPVPQAAKLVQAAFGGARGQGSPLPPMRPQFGQSQPTGGPQRPVRVPPPSVALKGQGGGLTPQSVMMADREALGKLGYNPAAQAAILGNVRQESNFDPRMDTRGGDSGTAHGQFQWRGDRGTKERSYARSKGLDPSSPAAQIGYMDQEVAAIPGLKQRLNQSDPATGAMLFGHDFERPKKVEQSRARYAEQFYKGGGGASNAPFKSSPASLQEPTTVPNVSGSGQDQGKSKPPAAQQSSAPPPPDVYHPSQPDFAIQQPQQPPPQPSGPYPVADPTTGKQGYAQAPQLGPPKITSPDQLKGMKPGSLWISPDGKLRIVPMEGQ